MQTAGADSLRGGDNFAHPYTVVALSTSPPSSKQTGNWLHNLQNHSLRNAIANKASCSLGPSEVSRGIARGLAALVGATSLMIRRSGNLCVAIE